MSVFGKQTWSIGDFNKLMKDRTMTSVYIPNPKDVLGQVGIEVILPNPTLKDSIMQISSYRLYKKVVRNIYVGPYKKVITLNADKALLGDGTSTEDGYDSLEFTFIDTKNRITYTCMQERSFHMWQLDKVVTISFLPQRKLDNNGEPYCYDAYIHHSIKP